MLDIHLGSISLVCTPAWSMLLNLIVMGKGNFTEYLSAKPEPLPDGSQNILMT